MPHLSREELIAIIELRKLDALADGDAAARLAAELQDLLGLTWDDLAREALNEAARQLLSGSGEIGGEELADALETIARALRTTYPALIETGLLDVIEVAYETAQTGVFRSAQVGLRPSFNLVDNRAISWLHEHHTYWVRNHFDRQVREDIVRIGERVIQEGLGRREAGQVFQQEVGEKLGQSQSYWESFSNHVTTRSREFGRIEAYVKAGIEELRISAVRDRRTSDVCEFLDGKIIRIADMVELRDRLMEAQSPEDVKEIAPWLDVEEIKTKVRGGYVTDPQLASPPYHWNCRTRTVIHKRSNQEETT